METVLITGGSGLIGSAITQALISCGFKVVILTRQKVGQPVNSSGVTYANWDIERQYIDAETIKGADHIIHLAGANVAEGRWTAKRKQEIVHSRVASGELLVKALRDIPNDVKTVIGASAIGWYGPDPHIPNLRPFVEADPADSSFLGNTCRLWERAIQPVSAMGKRLVIFRIGIVLSREGGAYAEFRKPLRFGIASVLGNGKQIISWIHIDDLVKLFIYAINNNQLSGIYNATAPEPVSNRQLITGLAKEKGGINIAAPVPAFVLKAMLGEMSIEVLKSATVSSQKIQQAGYRFQFPTIQSALKSLES